MFADIVSFLSFSWHSQSIIENEDSAEWILVITFLLLKVTPNLKIGSGYHINSQKSPLQECGCLKSVLKICFCKLAIKKRSVPCKGTDNFSDFASDSNWNYIFLITSGCFLCKLITRSTSISRNPLYRSAVV